MCAEIRVMCSVYDKDNRRAYTRNCTKVFRKDENAKNSYTSSDLQGHYESVCPYYERLGSHSIQLIIGLRNHY